MGDIGVCMINAAVVFIAVLSVILEFVSYKTYKMKEKLDESERIVESIITLKEIARKLNAASKIHEHRLDHQRDDIYGIKRRLDILEEGHPDTDIDYGTVDSDGNITEVWFEGKRYVPEDKRNDIDYTKTDGDGNILAVWFHGKKYVPEDKRDEETSTFYADNKVVAETAHMANVTQSEEKRCCATCRHYRPELDHTCTIRSWLCIPPARAVESSSVCNNYKKGSAVVAPSDKDGAEYIRFNYIRRDIGGNGKVEAPIKKIDELQIKIDYIDLLQKQKKVGDKMRDFNKQLESALQSGIMSAREWREFMEDLDSDT